MKEMNRREFLTLSGAAVVALSLAGCGGGAPPPPPHPLRAPLPGYSLWVGAAAGPPHLPHLRPLRAKRWPCSEPSTRSGMKSTEK